MRRLGGVFSQQTCVHEEYVRQSIAVIVEDGDAVAGGFNDVSLGSFRSRNVHAGEAGLGGDVSEIHDRRLHPRRERARRNRFASSSHALSWREFAATPEQ